MRPKFVRNETIYILTVKSPLKGVSAWNEGTLVEMCTEDVLVQTNKKFPFVYP